MSGRFCGPHKFAKFSSPQLRTLIRRTAATYQNAADPALRSQDGLAGRYEVVVIGLVMAFWAFCATRRRAASHGGTQPRPAEPQELWRPCVDSRCNPDRVFGVEHVADLTHDGRIAAPADALASVSDPGDGHPLRATHDGEDHFIPDAQGIGPNGSVEWLSVQYRPPFAGPTSIETGHENDSPGATISGPLCPGA